MPGSIAEGECLIEVVEPAGSDTFAVTKLGGKEVVARLRADAQHRSPAQPTPLAFNLDKAVFFDPRRESRIALSSHDDSPISSSSAPASAARRSRPGSPARGADDPHPGGAASVSPTGRRTATSGRSSSAAISGRRKSGTRPPARPSTPATITMSAATRSSTARCWSAIAREDFAEMQHLEGVSPAWPFPYEELEPWYGRAEQLFQVRGTLGEDPTEPPHSHALPVSAGARRAADRCVREPAEAARPASLFAAARRRYRPWLAKATHPVGRASATADDGKMDAETAALAQALRAPERQLQTGARVDAAGNLRADGKRIAAVVYQENGEETLRQPEARHALGRRRAVGGAAPALGDGPLSEGPRQRLRPGRPQLHEPQSLGGARGSTLLSQQLGLPEDLRLQRFLSRRDGNGGPPLGNVQLLGTHLGRHPEGQPAAGARMAARPAVRAMPSTSTP